MGCGVSTTVCSFILINPSKTTWDIVVNKLTNVKFQSSPTNEEDKYNYEEDTFLRLGYTAIILPAHELYLSI